MPYQYRGMTLQGIIADVAGGQQLREPVKALQRAARNLAAGMYNDPQWEAVQIALPPTAYDNILAGVTTGANLVSRALDFLLAATTVGSNWSLHRIVAPRLGWPPRESEAFMGMEETRPSKSDLRAAEAGLRSHLPQIAEHLADIEQAADEITADRRKRQAIGHITQIIGSTGASRLSPLALLVVMWWVFAVTNPYDASTDTSALALWYAVARKLWKKD
jgi:hypothetical protein